MSQDIQIDSARRLITRQWYGEITLDVLLQGLEELEQHPDFDPSFDHIADYTGAHVVASGRDLRLFGQHLKAREWTRVGRWVVVAPGSLEFGLGRQAMGLWADNLAVFRTQEEARAWLDHGAVDPG